MEIVVKLQDKDFKSVSSISSINNSTGELKIGIKSSGYTLNIENENDKLVQ